MLKNSICKIIAAVTFSAAALTFSGCAESENTQNVKISQNFTIHAKITDSDITAEADMQRSADGWLMTVTAPENVEGIQFLLSDGGWTISCEGLSYSAGEEQLPENSPLRLTARALDECVKDSDGSSGKIGGERYSVTFKDCKPAKLTVGSEVTVKFSKYKEKKNRTS